MNDQSSELENYNELKFSREQGFFDKNLGIRFLIGLVFMIPLFMILHFREVRIETLDLNHYAPSYIVAQVDTDFYNEEATILLKQEMVKDLGKIYRISEKEINERRLEFENFLIFNQDWRKSAPESSFEDVYKGGDNLVEALIKLRLTDPRTLQKTKENEINAENYQIYTPADLSEPVSLPPQIWKKLQTIALPKSEFHDGTITFLIEYFQEKFWILEEDIAAERELRKRIQAKVPDKYTHISAGSRIIDQGEKVNARHLAVLQAMKDALREQRNLWSPLTLLGSLLMTLLLTGISILYFRANHPNILSSNRKLFLLVTVIILTFGLAKLAEFFLLNTKTHLMEAVRYPLFVPFAAILLCSLMSPAVATFTSGFLAVVLGMTLAFDRQGFLLLNLIAAIIAVLSTHSLRRRKEIFVVCGKAWLGCAITILAMHLYQSTHWSTGLLADLLSTAIFMLLTAILVVGLLPLLESAFRIMTDVSLMEYMDPNNDLLRRLTIEAPGTYQHSIVVGNLAEAAALAIGANGLFCRVSTLYHDIGKMATPQYFTENQQGGMNIHQLLTPQESAQVIMAHVAEGVAIARKAGLPEQFIEVIKEHHGTTLVYYFYRKQLEKMGGDKSLVNEKEFRYAGPKPRSKESAIIMIADTVEAASRSLEQINEESLMELANRLIREKADDGQFDECLLTFEELAKVKETLVHTLVAYSHSRIKYPKREAPKEEHLC
ncbi:MULTISPECIES: HD family phosphohydrolase [Parachlamydia]|jgi:putative nucleotidyltransferase with HDIG domain|uniref:Putative membrane bound phosphohydrolase n=2 Tax=Parachlamydia acanthamoebae TaxID=83552 RepID=F8L240_PARAV|nr:HDIG domain-containing metalloprotein [Parachlamydia acanthamoebae]CCB87364.1 putative membrane bound phosphohydrolase [Parachlamydia acanthamoebae UV-7]